MPKYIRIRQDTLYIVATRILYKKNKKVKYLKQYNKIFWAFSSILHHTLQHPIHLDHGILPVARIECMIHRHRWWAPLSNSHRISKVGPNLPIDGNWSFHYFHLHVDPKGSDILLYSLKIISVRVFFYWKKASKCCCARTTYWESLSFNSSSKMIVGSFSLCSLFNPSSIG